HRTAPRTSSRKTAVISAGMLTESTCFGDLRGWRGDVVDGSDGAGDSLGRTRVDGDATGCVEFDGEVVHRSWRRTLDDLTVAVVDRAVARTLEAALVAIRQVAAVGRAGHSWVGRGPRHGAAQVWAFPVQGHEPFGHAR